ncbi:MAG: isoprenylcysteine carboxylmethyltransferase family protein [Hyphomicrobium sp.]
MIPYLAFAGLSAAFVLIILLGGTYLGFGRRIWPAPGPGTWQSRLFWLLFRVSNVTALAISSLTVFGPAHEPALDLSQAARIVAACIATIFICLYALALVTLGRPNTYCGHEGLIRSGIYEWTRNPQYATIIPFYAALAVAADTPWLYALTAALIVIYVLMALNEEPWLRTRYGTDYDAYCHDVSRFFTAGRVTSAVRRGMAQLSAASRPTRLSEPP